MAGKTLLSANLQHCFGLAHRIGHIPAVQQTEADDPRQLSSGQFGSSSPPRVVDTTKLRLPPQTRTDGLHRFAEISRDVAAVMLHPMLDPDEHTARDHLLHPSARPAADEAMKRLSPATVGAGVDGLSLSRGCAPPLCRE